MSSEKAEKVRRKEQEDQLRKTSPWELDSMRALLLAGANPNTPSKGKYLSPLLAASLNGVVETIALLLDFGASVNEKAGPADYHTALHAAIFGDHEDAVRLLCERGADVNSKSWNDMTPLGMAIYRKNMVLMQVLLQYAADPNKNVIWKVSPGFAVFSTMMCGKHKTVHPACQKCLGRDQGLAALTMLRQFGATIFLQEGKTGNDVEEDVKAWFESLDAKGMAGGQWIHQKVQAAEPIAKGVANLAINSGLNAAGVPISMNAHLLR
jgi:ankyrin repeat protein